MKKMFGFTLLALFLGVTGAYPEKSARFEGIIINVDDASIEIKHGKKEITVYWLENSKIMFNGKEVGREAVQVCQKARVVFAAGQDRNDVVTLEILRESYCTR